MQTTELSPLGVRVADIRIGKLDDPEVGQLRHLLAVHGVAVLPGSEVDDAGFLDFLRSFGDTVFTAGETPVPGFPDLNVVSNVGRTTPPRSTFHVDTSYVRTPPAFTALRAVVLPEQGGQTLFSDQYSAYDTLPADIRDDLDGRTITHVVTGLDLDDGEETSADHPIFRRHPITGRVCLYLSAPKRCAQISGMSAELTAETIAYLFEHSTRGDNVYRHAWSPGDVVMWDNRCVMHRADHTDVVGDRVMHRGMVADND